MCGSLNVGAHVQDNPLDVAENRRRIAAAFELPSEPAWLTQVHGNRVVRLDGDELPSPRRRRGPSPSSPGGVCVIQVADCLPVLFAARDGSIVGAAHAGWRASLPGFSRIRWQPSAAPPGQLLAWIGPRIGRRHFEVGPEVREAFIGLARTGTAAVEAAFVPNARGSLVTATLRRWPGCDSKPAV